jgi:hypothetical protein
MPTVEEIASAALIEAIDDGANSAEEVRNTIQELPLNDWLIGGFDHDDVIAAYSNYDRRGTDDDRTFNPDFRWPRDSGTLLELLFLGAVYYIAEVAARIFEEEQANIQPEPDLGDYPLR